MKWGVLGLGSGVAVLATILAGGLLTERLTSGDSVGPQPPAFAVVSPDPDQGPGVATEFQQARLTSTGDLQVLASTGACDTVTEVAVVEDTDTVTVTVSAARLPGTCTANVVPRFVRVPLTQPLAARALVDASDGRTHPVVDCTVTPSPTRGLCVATPPN